MTPNLAILFEYFQRGCEGMQKNSVMMGGITT